MHQDDLVYLKKPNSFLLSGTEGQKQIDEPWYNLLRNTSEIRGEKALMGRNNVIFTLALACYSSGVSYEDCENDLNNFNDDLKFPLKQLELKKIIRSAYSGKYEAASRDFVKELCQIWVDDSLTSKDLFIRQGWYKFKKARADRQRSHFSEWKEDLLTYIEENTSKSSPYLNIKKKDIISHLGIPERSLDYVLKELKNDYKILYTFKRGRGGGIRVASISAILMAIIALNKENRQRYYQQLSELLESSQKAIEVVIERQLHNLLKAQKNSLFELDIG